MSEYKQFARALDESDIEVSDWEARFLDRVLKADDLTGYDCDVIAELQDKYSDKIGYRGPWLR